MVRLRTLFTLSAGAAVGAGTMYLTDPEHGPVRRRRARQQAVAQARQRAATAASDSRRHAADLLASAVSGYQQVRDEPADVTPSRRPGRP
jgi:uncharacterized protein YggE